MKLPDDISELAARLVSRLLDVLFVELEQSLAKRTGEALGAATIPIIKGLLDPSIRATLKQRALVEFLAEKALIDAAAFEAFYEKYEREHLGSVREELFRTVSRELPFGRPPSAS